MVWCIWKVLKQRCAHNVEDFNVAFLFWDIPFADCKILARDTPCDVRDCLGAVRTCADLNLNFKSGLTWEEILVLLINFVNHCVVTSHIDQRVVILERQTLLNVGIDSKVVPKYRVCATFLLTLV